VLAVEPTAGRHPIRVRTVPFHYANGRNQGESHGITGFDAGPDLARPTSPRAAFHICRSSVVEPAQSTAEFFSTSRVPQAWSSTEGTPRRWGAGHAVSHTATGQKPRPFRYDELNDAAGINVGPAGWILAADSSQAGCSGNGPWDGASRQTGSGQAFRGLSAGARPPAHGRRPWRWQNHAGAGVGPGGHLPVSSASIH